MFWVKFVIYIVASLAVVSSIQPLTKWAETGKVGLVTWKYRVFMGLSPFIVLAPFGVAYILFIW